MSEGSRAGTRNVVYLALACLGSFVSLPCAAQGDEAPEGVTIDWSAPSGCPTYADVASWLEAVLPPDVKQRLGSTKARVTLEAVPGGTFRARVQVDTADDQAGSPSGERTLEGAACDELARSAVVIVSVALTEAVAERSEPPPAKAPEAPPVLPSAPTATGHARQPRPHPPKPDDAISEPAVISISSGVAAGFDSYALRADLAVRWPVLRVGSIGARLRFVPHATAETPSSDVDLTLLTAAPEGCALMLAAQALRLGACVRTEFGTLRASGSGAAGLTDDSLWAALGALPFLEWGTDFRLLVAGDADLRLLRPTLEFDDGQTLERLPRFAYAALLGLAATIP